jgi:hypothetical protein
MDRLDAHLRGNVEAGWHAAFDKLAARIGA